MVGQHTGSLDVFILKQEVGDLGIATLEILEAITVDWPHVWEKTGGHKAN